MVSAFNSLGALSSVILHCYTWIRLAGLSWWCYFLGGLGLIRLMVWGGSFCLICTGPARVLMEIGYWDVVLCVWAIFSVFSILAIYMARSKNTGKGKAPSTSMERAVKKRKSDTS